MKAIIEFENTDADGEVTKSKVSAVMEVRQNDFRLVYVEDLSGDGKLTKSTLTLSGDSMRIIRKGELTTDFIYGMNLIHNTTYQTPYGTLPVVVETENYSFEAEGVSEENNALQENFRLQVQTAYKLIVGGEEPLKLNMKITVRLQDKPHERVEA